MNESLDQTQETGDSSGILGSILKENGVFLGGSSMGKGFRRAARYYLRKQAPLKVPASTFSTESTTLLNEGVGYRVEDPFYVVDIGMVVSQYYQWQKNFPRVDVFYAVKCNPDPVLLKTLATLGCNFDCASKNEIRLIQDIARQLSADKPCAPEIIYANPTKARSHIIEAVCRNVTLMTFDNVEEVKKCAAISSKIQLVLRIITDDAGSQCRLSSKYGAPKKAWRDLLSAAKGHRMEVVGVSFHVGSGCRDASRYQLALRDARELFDLAESDFGFQMKLLDIGGGFPGETHSLWNPSTVFGDPTAAVEPPIVRRKYTIDEELDEEEGEDDEKEGNEKDFEEEKRGGDKPLMYFDEIAQAIVPMLDELFPSDSGVRIIAEPGRYLTAASSTLCASIVSVRSNARSEGAVPKGVSDGHAAFHVDQITRAEENQIVQDQSKPEHPIIDTIVEELADYSKLFARLNLSQQEVDVYTEKADLTAGKLKIAASLLAPPEDRLPDGVKPKEHHTVEGMQMGIVTDSVDKRMGEEAESQSIITGSLTLAAAGEAAVSGVLVQAVADSAPLQDEFAYYINDGCYGSFNNILFDHATVRPRRLRDAISKNHRVVETDQDGLKILEAVENGDDSSLDGTDIDDSLYPSTVWGPTCDSMDVISRSVLLPKMRIGDWLYFQNMGAYTCAAASTFNGFSPTDKFYVCSVLPEHFEELDGGVKSDISSTGEEKKDTDI
eukprot:CAMPEP_0197466226 /NCGR_PEP_ID=MMETSP1175-20131217/64941_1 /TAXON_ID=1003142 /ORGANISM="Triceratium dubium, Strain CCMP147" /LENGTH=722 /DNA_ID=CAMNT_0043002257 /DNA_START=42 /DNA_END=2210 /DNA_ORIENTATION=-